MQGGTAGRPAGDRCRPGRAGRGGPGRGGAGGAPTHPAGGAPTCTYSLRTPGSRDSAVSRRLSVPWATHSSSTSRKMKSPAEERHPKTSTAGPSAWPWRCLSARSCQNPWEGGRRGEHGGWSAVGGRAPAARAPCCVQLRRPRQQRTDTVQGPAGSRAVWKARALDDSPALESQAGSSFSPAGRRATPKASRPAPLKGQGPGVARRSPGRAPARCRLPP